MTSPDYSALVAAVKDLAVDSGKASSPVAASGNDLRDTNKSWAVNIHRNRLVKIISGHGSGQQAVIESNTTNTLHIWGTWPQAISAGASYIILDKDLAQMLRDVLGGGSNISAANPLETHDPTIEDVETKLDHPDHGLAALKALIDSLAGGAFYGSYGPKNVEVDNEVDFGTILYDPAGNVITVGEITPGTYTIHRVRVAAVTEIVAAVASSEAAGRVYITYNFPAASWNVGDIFYVTFTGIQVTLNGVTTEYPNLYIWGRVVREPSIEAQVGKLTGLEGVGTHSHVNNLNWQDVVAITTGARHKVHAVWLDFFNLTQNMNMRMEYEVDGANPRVFWTDTWLVTEEDGVLINVPRAIAHNFTLGLQSAVLEGAARDIPYEVIYEEME